MIDFLPQNKSLKETHTNLKITTLIHANDIYVLLLCIILLVKKVQRFSSENDESKTKI